MDVSVPKETRPFEYRVGLPPAGALAITQFGHNVFVEHSAGEGAGFSDEDYARAGAQVVYSREEAFGRGELVLKFSRPTLDELQMIRPESTVMGFLHLVAAKQDKIDFMKKNKLTAIAYEQIEDESGYRPVLTPLSQIGGRMAVQIAARLLQNDHGGRGILLGDVAGVPSAEVVIVGAGAVGATAACAFSEVGAHVTVLDVDLRRLQDLHARIPQHIVTMRATPYNLHRACAYADVLIGAILIPGERTPVVITRSMLSQMKPRALFIDMSIDQGGCAETSRPTSYASSTYIEEGVIHFCVPNISGVLGRTASHALYIGAYPYLEAISKLGVTEAIKKNTALERGVNVLKGKISHMTRLGRQGGAS
jgi:alanine dehydrogenase